MKNKYESSISKQNYCDLIFFAVSKKSSQVTSRVKDVYIAMIFHRIVNERCMKRAHLNLKSDSI